MLGLDCIYTISLSEQMEIQLCSCKIKIVFIGFRSKLTTNIYLYATLDKRMKNRMERRVKYLTKENEEYLSSCYLVEEKVIEKRKCIF